MITTRGDARRRRVPRIARSTTLPPETERAAQARENAAERQRRSRANRRDAQERALQLALNGESVGLGTEPAPRRDVHRVSFRICDFILSELESVGGDNHYRHAVLESVLVNKSIVPLLPECYREVKASHAFVKSCRNELKLLKNPCSKEKLVRKAALLEAATSMEVSGVRALSRLLETRPSNISAALQRRQSLESSGLGIFGLAQRRKRPGLSSSAKELVISWWTQETRVSPNKKDVRRKRLRPNVYETHATHLLLEGQASLYDRFCHAHPEVEVCMRAFEKLRPYFVKKCSERNVCCCRYHVELDMLRESLVSLRDDTRGFHKGIGCSCSCLVCCGLGPDQCSAHLMKFDGVTKLWEHVVCPKSETDDFHRLECLMGSCSTCGGHTLPICPEEMSESPFRLKWRRFSSEVIGVNDDGKPKKRVGEVHMETTCSEFFAYLLPKLHKFITHNFVSRWQDVQCRASMRELGFDVILSHIDFAENYTFQIQNEIQSMHWQSTQVTILVHITYRYSLQARTVVKESHFYISDDRTHDTLFVQHCFMLHWEWLKTRDVEINHHCVWSDGCSGQFKGARSMYFVARYPGLTDGCGMAWNYFGTGHGKGEWDGAGAVLKRALRAEQLQNPWRKLQDAQDSVDFLEEKLGGLVENSVGDGKIVSYRYFHCVRVQEVDRRHPHACSTIPGSRRLHCVRAVSLADPLLLMVRELSCYCSQCLDGQWEACEKSTHVSPWSVIKLSPTNVSFARDMMLQGQPVSAEEDAWEYAVHDSMGDLVEMGDNFAIGADEDNDEGVEFYVLQCQRRKVVVKEKFSCVWGGEFEPGQYVIVGKYYQKWGTSPNSFVFLRNSRVAYIDATLVLACKFSMVPAAHRVKGGDPVYQLSDESIDVIRTSLESF